MGFLSGIVNNIGGIASGLGSVAGVLIGGHQSKNEGQANREWQQNMIDTSFERKLASMKRAGVNPLLGVQGLGNGAPASTVEPRSGVTVDSVINMINAMTAASSAKSTEKLQRAEEGLKVQQAITEEKTQKQKELDKLLTGKKIDTEKLTQNYLAAQTDAEKRRILNMIKEGKNIDAQTHNTIQKTLMDMEELEVRKKDYGRSAEGLRDKHEASTHGSLFSTLGTEVGRFASNAVKAGQKLKSEMKKMKDYDGLFKSGPKRTRRGGRTWRR